MVSPTVTEIKHLSPHATVPVVVTSSGHVLPLSGLPAQPKDRLL